MKSASVKNRVLRKELWSRSPGYKNGKLTKILDIKLLEFLQYSNLGDNSLRFQLFCGFGWSWHGHWHWQGRSRFKAPSVSTTLLRKYCSESFAIFCRKNFKNHNFLILHDVRNLGFHVDAFSSGITVLTAFNRNSRGLSGSPCQYKGVKSVLPKI